MRARPLLAVTALCAAVLTAPGAGAADALPTAATTARVPTAVASDAHWVLHTDGPELDDPLNPYEVDARAPWSPDEYDGAVFTKDAPDLTDLPTVHTVYMHARDMPSRFGEFAAMFQADARQSSDLLNRLYGRGVRFDDRLGSDGETYLDITVVKSQYPLAALTAPQLQPGFVRSELERVGLDQPDKKYAVWLDAPSYACGQAYMSEDPRRSPSNNNEASSLAIVYRNYARSPGGGRGDLDGGGFCRGRVLLHELGHAFGVVPSQAPNNFDGAHCDDSAEDVMCYKNPNVPDTGGPEFDYNNDDYWDPAADPASGSTEKLPWWTANLSRFVCPTDGCDLPNADPGY